MGPNKALTFDKYEMCCSLLYQFNSVFIKPHSEEIVTNPSSFLSMQPSMSNTTDFYLTDIVLSEKILLMLYKSFHPLQQPGQMAYLHHYW